MAIGSYRAVTPAKAGVQETPEKNWVPAFAGTTGGDVSVADKVIVHPYGADIGGPERPFCKKAHPAGFRNLLDFVCD